VNDRQQLRSNHRTAPGAYQQLHTKKIQAETNLENAKSKLKELQDEARQKFGTDDVAALQAKLDEMKADNENKRREYQASLEAIQTALDAVETNLNAAATSPHKPSG
jgi:vacuolar-type H+-ATPase subunit E/Vma4